MLLALTVDHREIEINTGGTLWLKTTYREIFIAREPRVPFWPHLERYGKHGGMWTGFGFEVSFDRAGGAPVLARRR